MAERDFIHMHITRAGREKSLFHISHRIEVATVKRSHNVVLIGLTRNCLDGRSAFLIWDFSEGLIRSSIQGLSMEIRSCKHTTPSRFAQDSMAFKSGVVIFSTEYEDGLSCSCAMQA